MEYPEGRPPELSASDSTPATSTSAVKSFQDLQILVDYGAETADDPSAKTANDQGTQNPADHGAQADAGNGTQAAARTLGVLLEGIADGRHAVVEVEDVSLNAKLVDLPCVIGSLKTIDNKTFYKTADISQEVDFNQVEEVSFTEYIDSPDVEKEVKRLLCSDAEAVSARWEVIAEGESKEIESQGSIPDASGYKQGHSSSVMEIQKQIHYLEKKLREVQCRAQRQKELIMKVENLTLKDCVWLFASYGTRAEVEF
ncbi:Transcription initiation factor TFIID subunit 7 [Pteropus alecto]|uniref:Transcription initiation factor TFIID subunit 7 n=1 Tax=Pteropus alecto TaxID=9402 RepID=L5K1C2_PTEAL|nr:Transcription initiation factor TFIID subunit 7 [Pteropus alecto]